MLSTEGEDVPVWRLAVTPAPRGSEPRDRESAADLDDRAGGVRKVAAQQRRHRAPYIAGLSPTALRNEAIRDAAIVDVAHAGGHVGCDDAWSDFEDGDTVAGEPRGKQTNCHRKASL